MDQDSAQNIIAKMAKILVVDDEPGIRMVLEQKLSKAGYRIALAATGLHALQKIHGGFKPDLVICDIKMPGMNAPELLEKIRGTEATKDIRFLIMTAYAEKPVILGAAKYGISDVLLKPFQHEELLTKVRAILSKP